jgi:hypothetical protein
MVNCWNVVKLCEIHVSISLGLWNPSNVWCPLFSWSSYNFPCFSHYFSPFFIRPRQCFLKKHDVPSATATHLAASPWLPPRQPPLRSRLRELPIPPPTPHGHMRRCPCFIHIYMLICCDFSKWCICFWYMFWYDLVCHMSNIIIIVVVLLLIVIVIIITVFVIHAPAPKWSWNQLFLCTQLPRPLSSPWAFLVVGPWLRTVPGVPRFSAPFQTIRNAFRNERYMV